MELPLDDQYWSERYSLKQTAWDVHAATPPLTKYIDQVKRKDLKILIPGCGNAYEAEYLCKNEFKQVTLLDLSAVLIQSLQQRFAGKPIQILHQDFFEHRGQYDLILEQTFFCALNPNLRQAYADQMHALLKPGGTLAGVLFNRKFEGGPPFGGSASEYRNLFCRSFTIHTLEPCYNSIPPRADNELFFILRKMDKTLC